jgi:hypothetical protein
VPAASSINLLRAGPRRDDQPDDGIFDDPDSSCTSASSQLIAGQANLPGL